MPETPVLKSPDGNHSMTLLPPAADKCQTCATAHEPTLPHNAQSLYYQMQFQMKHKRWPTWIDAMAHCTSFIRKHWTAELKGMGVDVKAGQISPKGKANAKKKA